MQTPQYHAGSTTGERTWSISGRNLHVVGTKVDTIKEVSTIFTLKDREDEHLALILSWRNFLDLDHRKDDAYICGGTLHEAYQATVFAGLYEDEAGWRSLTAEDLDKWNSHLSEITRRLRGQGPSMAGKLHPSMSAHNVAVLRRRLCVLAKGYIGLCPASAEIGDEAYVLDRSPAPIFVRAIVKEDESSRGYRDYRALGHGYVDGIMDGEVAGMGLPKSSIRII